MRAALAAVSLAAAVVLAGCGGSGSISVPKGAVAQVGDRTITTQQLSSLLASARAYSASQGSMLPKPGTAGYAKLRAQAIAYLVEGAMVVQQAAKSGVVVSDARVDAAIAAVRKKSFGGSEQRLAAELKAEGLTPAVFREQERVTLTESALQRKLTSSVTVTDGQGRAYYAKHVSTYTTPASRTVRHILVAKRALAESLYAQLRKGADFAALAKRYSTDTGSKKQGGVLMDTKGSFVPAFEKVAFSLKTNEISKPVHSQYGWHIIQALAPTTPAAVKPYSSVRAAIHSQLLQAEQAKVLTSWSKQTQKAFCPGRIAYAAGYAPAQGQSDACTASNG